MDNPQPSPNREGKAHCRMCCFLILARMQFTGQMSVEVTTRMAVEDF